MVSTPVTAVRCCNSLAEVCLRVDKMSLATQCALMDQHAGCQPRVRGVQSSQHCSNSTLPRVSVCLCRQVHHDQTANIHKCLTLLSCFILLHWLCCRTFNIGGGAYNSFAMTRSAINRFGLFDENIYPSFYEDNDFQLRQARMQPPMQPKTLEGVVMHHGKPHESGYSSGVHTPDDPTHKDAEQNIRAAWQQRFVVNGNYIYRKWGCQPGSWASCAYKTPFNKTVPVW